MIPFAKRKAAHLKLGQLGEKIAANLCVELGLDILTKNYSCKYGEIDIIARNGETICFIEVKTRHAMHNSRPADAVGIVKQQKIIKTAKQYIAHLPNQNLLYQYDIIEIIIVKSQLKFAKYWANAFNENQQPEFSQAFHNLQNDDIIDQKKLDDPSKWQFFQ